MKKQEEIIAFRLSRSKDALKEARILRDADFWNAVASRLYYAAYYAVSALLLQEGVTTKTHTGQKNKFNDLFIKTGQLDAETGAIYNDLFLLRQESDYEDFVIFKSSEVEPLLEKAEAFTEIIEHLLRKS